MASVRELIQAFEKLCGSRTAQRRRTDRARSGLALEHLESRVLLAGVMESIPAFTGTIGPGSGSSPVNPLTSIPVLNSRPGAPVQIYLDFDGHTETQDWPGQRTDNQSGPIITPVFDVDGDQTTFSDQELQMIEEVWYRVAEDYSPFNVNVTTVDPTTYNDFETILVSIGGNGSWIGSPGGIAWINAFSNGLSNTCYVFSDNTGFGTSFHMQGTALAASHEVGHTLGLLHHAVYDANGNLTAGYDPGNGTIGPIMGAPYDNEREVWSNAADDNGVNSLQDDMAVMTRAANQTFQYRIDDHGNTIATATKINVTSPQVSASGILERTGDVDYFSVETNSGQISFNVNGLDLNQVFNTTGLHPGTNVNLTLSLYDSNGNLIASDSPANSLNASVSANVNGGIYYIAVSGSGLYGDVGQYWLDGTVIPVPAVPVMIGPTGILADPVPVFEWTVAGNTDHYELEALSATTGALVYAQRALPATQVTHQAQQQFPEGSFEARVRSVAADGTMSAWSNLVSFSIDIPAPPQPVIIAPTGNIAEPFPTFQWLQAGNATSYSLWVNDFNTGKRVIYRTSENALSYVHFDPLKDGTYRAWVRAFNTLGDASPWSTFVEFTIDTPVPDQPIITAPATPTTNLAPRIVWTELASVARYDLWVDYRSGGKPQFIRQQNLTASKYWYDPTALPQGRYTAWVRGINANDEAGPWSPAYSFEIDLEPPTTPQMTGPVGANGGLTLITANPTFTWSTADRAVYYDLWVNNVTTGQVQIVRKTDLKATQFQSLTNLPQGDYRAWVRAVNAAGEVGAWSNVYKFSIDDPTPSVPVFTGPKANPAGVVATATPMFTWTGDIKGTSYDLWIDDKSIGKSQVIRSKTVPEESYVVPTSQSLSEHIYTAWVRAVNASGEYSSWSAPYTIRIDIPNPSTPEILNPSNTISDTTPTFEWTHDGTATQYEILVRDLERAENIVLQVTSLNLSPDGKVASYTLPDARAFLPGTYRFWIRAFNAVGQSSSWSSSRSFVIAAVDQTPSEGLRDQVLLTSLAVPVQKESSSEMIRMTPVRRPVKTETVDAAVPADVQTPAAEAPSAQTDAADVEEAIEAVMTEFADPAFRFEISSDEEQDSTSPAVLAFAALPLALVARDEKRKR
ncbi:MAG: hypothetical protein KDA96_11920 [Planctomycetaceae bacterium]|nr:hypothetical protein [Planctomycetaceae bacterium]